MNKLTEKNKKTGIKSMKLKLVLTFLSMNILTLLAISFAVGISAYRVISAENNMKLINASEKNSMEIDGWLAVQGQIISEVTDSLGTQEVMDRDKTLEYLTLKTESNPYVLDVYMGFEDKSFLDGSGWKAPADYDCTSRAWYINAKEKGTLIYGTPSMDVTTGEMVMVISKPVTIGGSFAGVVGVDVNLGTLNEIAQKSVTSPDSYAFLTDDQDNIMIHPNKEYMPEEETSHNLKEALGVNSADIVSRIAQNSQLTTKKDYDGNLRHFVMTEIKTTNWKFGIAVSDSEYIKPVHNLLRVLILCSLLTSLFVAFISYLVGGRNAKPIISLTAAICKQAGLDFSHDSQAAFLKYEKRRDEIGIITNSLLTMENNVRQLLIQTSDAVSQVSSTAEELSASSRQSAAAADEVSGTINRIAQGTAEQAGNMSAGTLSLQDLSNLIDSDKNHLDYLADETRQVNQLIKKGLDDVATLSLRAQANGQSVSTAYKSIQKANESSEKISEASSFISSVAAQTNLLALNAAIEAARAGENGKGFAIVAEEIRRLAEQSTDSAKTIHDIIKSLQEDAAIAAKEMEEADSLVREQSQSVKETELNFNEISAAIRSAGDAVHSLNESGSRMNLRKDEVFYNIGNLSAAADETAAALQETAAAMEEATASSEEIANASENLSTITAELQLLINKFKV